MAVAMLISAAVITAHPVHHNNSNNVQRLPNKPHVSNLRLIRTKPLSIISLI